MTLIVVGSSQGYRSRPSFSESGLLPRGVIIKHISYVRLRRCTSSTNLLSPIVSVNLVNPPLSSTFVVCCCQRLLNVRNTPVVFQVCCYSPRFASANAQTSHTVVYDENVGYEDVGMISCITSQHEFVVVLASVIAVVVSAAATLLPKATAMAANNSNGN